MSSLRALFSTIVILSFITSIDGQATCYFPKGSVAAEYTPCNPDQPHSQCCKRAEICLSNGLCFAEDVNRVRRGSCTDPAWGSGSCSQICTSANDTDPDWADVSACPGALPGVWYCGYQNVDRCKGPNQNTFGLAPGFFADFRNTTKFTTVTVSVNATSATPTSSDIRAAPTGSTSATCNLTSAANSCSSVVTVHKGIEAGVGIPLCLCLLASILFYLRERRLRSKLNVAYEQALKNPPLSEREREYEQSLAQLQEADATLRQAIFEAPLTPARMPELRS